MISFSVPFHLVVAPECSTQFVLKMSEQLCTPIYGLHFIHQACCDSHQELQAIIF